HHVVHGCLHKNLPCEPKKRAPLMRGSFISTVTKFRLASDLASDLATAGREAQAEQAEAETGGRRRVTHRAAAPLIAPRLEVRSAELEVTAVRADLHVQLAVADQAGHDEVEAVPENDIAI